MAGHTKYSQSAASSVTRDSNSTTKDSTQLCNCSVTDEFLQLPVTQNKTQFVVDPYIVQSTTMVEQNKSCYRISGVPAKLENIDCTGRGHPKAIYHIIPKSHVHLSNVVLVKDEDEKRRYEENDPLMVQRVREFERLTLENYLDEHKIEPYMFYQVGTVDPQMFSWTTTTAASTTTSTTTTVASTSPAATSAVKSSKKARRKSVSSNGRNHKASGRGHHAA